jgi:uncharacterized protein
MRMASLYRYPVKGLSPQRLSRVVLEANSYFPGDRMFAIENGPSGFDPTAPSHQPKIKFLMLMRNAALARLVCRYDDASGVLSIMRDGHVVADGDLATVEGRAAIEHFMAHDMGDDLRGPPRVLTAPNGFRFTDSKSGFVSLINLASVAALSARLEAPVDPLRFRANLYIENLAAWTELDWPAGTILTGQSGTQLKVLKRIDRCAATEVDPASGVRDLPIPKTLLRDYGHIDCGVYLAVTGGGALAEGEHLTLNLPEPYKNALGVG